MARANDTSRGQMEIIDVFLRVPEFRQDVQEIFGEMALRVEHERELQRARKARRAAHRVGRDQFKDEQIEAIIRLLKRRSIQLTPRQMARLYRRPVEQLVLVCAAAVTAENVTDFERKASFRGKASRRTKPGRSAPN